jgi:hypothetical protein
MGAGYAAAASCKVTGIHYLNLKTGRCPLCGDQIVKKAAVATDTPGRKEPGRRPVGKNLP